MRPSFPLQLSSVLLSNIQHPLLKSRYCSVQVFDFVVPIRQLVILPDKLSLFGSQNLAEFLDVVLPSLQDLFVPDCAPLRLL